MAMNQSCYGLKSTVGSLGFFTFFATRGAISSLQQNAHGSIFDTITKATFEGLSIDVPNETCIAKFEAQVEPVMGQIRELLVEIDGLSNARDELLPLLLAGKVTPGELAA